MIVVAVLSHIAFSLRSQTLQLAQDRAIQGDSDVPGFIPAGIIIPGIISGGPIRGRPKKQWGERFGRSPQIFVSLVC
jgi:hypothetical protein